MSGDRAERTLVIIPAFNEEAALPGVLEELAEMVPGVDVLVVDDGSSDSTVAVARQAGVAVAELPFHVGLGGGLRTGFRYALRHGYQQAVQLDADGQHDPAEIKTLLDALHEGVDLVIGSRFADADADPDARYGVGRVRAGAMGVLRLAVRLFSGRSFTDTSSGFRAFSAPMLDFFAHRYPVDYMESAEALLLACWAGFEVVEVPTPMRQRAAGRPSTRNVRLIYHYVRTLVTMLGTAPLRRRHTRVSS